MIAGKPSGELGATPVSYHLGEKGVEPQAVDDVRARGGLAVQRQQAAVQDIFPTLLALAGQTAPRTHVVDGLRLDTLLAGKADPVRPETFLMHYPHAPHRTDYWTSYRDGEWKVIYHYFPTAVSQDSHYQLYHLAEDPFEANDLAPTRPEELRRMMQGLAASLEKHAALYPVAADGATALKPKLP